MFSTTLIEQCKNTISRISQDKAPLVLAAMNELMDQCASYTKDDDAQVVENMLTTKEAAIKRMKGDTRSKDSLARAVFNCLKEAIAGYKKLNFPSEEKTIKTSPHWKEDSLRMQQELLMTSDEFSQTLKEVEAYATRYHRFPGQILIGYAIPSRTHASYIDWTEKFITNLQKQLISAGFADTQLVNDHRSILDIENCGRVILVGTELLMSQKDDITTGLIGNTCRRLEKERSKSANIIILLVISGNVTTSLPLSFSNITPAIFNEGESYLHHLYKLIKQLYQSQDDGLDEILKSFFTKLKIDKDIKKQQLALVLDKGLDESAVLARVKAEAEEAEIARQHREEASRRLLNGGRSSTSSISSMLPEVKQDGLVSAVPPLAPVVVMVSSGNHVKKDELPSDPFRPQAPGGPR